MRDAELVYRFWSDEEVNFWGNGGRGNTFATLTEVEGFIRSLTADAPRGLFMIELTGAGPEPEPIGTCNFRDYDPVTRRATVGISIGVREHWGQGYGTEAMRQMVRILFTRYNLHRIDLDTFAENKRAIRSYEKCGFVVEGVLRQAAWTLNGYRDQVLMGLLREDWLREQGELRAYL